MALCYPLVDPQLPNISVISEQFQPKNIIVILEWTPVNNSLISYHVSVIPQTAISYNHESIKVQLTIPYKTFYNVSISAVILCGPNTTTSIALNYSK